LNQRAQSAEYNGKEISKASTLEGIFLSDLSSNRDGTAEGTTNNREKITKSTRMLFHGCLLVAQLASSTKHGKDADFAVSTAVKETSFPL